jgi:hypothetical protein
MGTETCMRCVRDLYTKTVAFYVLINCELVKKKRILYLAILIPMKTFDIFTCKS